MRTIQPQQFSRLKADLEEIYGPQPDNVWEAALTFWRANASGSDPDGDVRKAMPAFLRAAAPGIAAVYQDKRRGAPRQIAGGDKLEREHARLVSERMGLVGNADPDVHGIRISLWGNPDPLTPEAARAFLESPLLRHVTEHDLKKWGIPPVGHTASVIARETTAKHEIETIEVAWLDTDEKSQRLTVRPGQLLGWEHEADVLEFPTEQGHSATVRVSPFSILGSLYREAEYLSHQAPFNVWHYFGERPPLATSTWFLLTGQVPTLPPVSVHWTVPGSIDVITIHALARVASPESIRQAYAKAYEKALQIRRRRPFEARTLRLVQFVEKQLGGPAASLSSEQAEHLWKKWNEAHPSVSRGRFRWPRDLRKTYYRGVRAFFRDPRGWDEEAILRGEWPHELEALVVIQRERARRQGRTLSAEEAARFVLDVISRPSQNHRGVGSRSRQF